MRSFLIWESDEDLSARDWVVELTRDIMIDFGRAAWWLFRLMLWAGFIAYMLMSWVV